MLFWFSGTGNSEQVAKVLEERMNETSISITKAHLSKQWTYELKENEKIGFIFPVYYYGLPKIVDEFVSHLTFKNSDKNYVYAMITCGGSSGTSAFMLKERLLEKGLELKLSYDLVMVDNYILMYSLPHKEKQEEILNHAKVDLERIIQEIEKEASHLHVPFKDRLLGKTMYKAYDRSRKTKKFNVNDACIGCGLCALRCPSQAIELKQGKPVWVKDKCNHCLACIHRCPKRAINYGSSTKHRERYVCPSLK